MKNTKVYAGVASAVLFLSVALLAVVLLTSDFGDDPRNAIVAALIAFIAGIALAATTWSYLGSNIRNN